MKKLLFAAVAVITFGAANAQDLVSKKGENYLPEAGDWALGFNANNIFQYVGNSFNGNTNNGAPSVTYQVDNTFVGKKFITDKKALRVIANLRFGSDKTSVPTVSTAGTTETTTIVENVNSGFDLQVGLGKEWRKGNTRLQGFYGADASLVVSSGKNKNTTESTAVTTVGNAVTTSNSSVEVVSKDGFGLGVALQGFIGAEYFLFPKISIGAQYTWGPVITIQGKSNVSTSTSATGSPSTSSSVDGGKASNFGFGGVGVSSMNLTLHF